MWKTARFRFPCNEIGTNPEPKPEPESTCQKSEPELKKIVTVPQHCHEVPLWTKFNELFAVQYKRVKGKTEKR